MGLKPDRRIEMTEIRYYMNEVAERGGIAVYSTAGSGAAMDQAAMLITYAANPSGGKPVGVLYQDMVNYDQTRLHPNYYRSEQQKGTKICVAQKGWVNTNWIVPGENPTGAGQAAYVGPSGYFSTVDRYGASIPAVGRFETKRDSDGYACVSINLP